MGSSTSKEPSYNKNIFTKNQLLALIQDQRIKERSQNVVKYENYQTQRTQIGLWDSEFNEAIKIFLQNQPSIIPHIIYHNNLFNMSETLTFDEISKKWTKENLHISTILSIDTTLLLKSSSKEYFGTFAQIIIYFYKILDVYLSFIRSELESWFSNVTLKFSNILTEFEDFMFIPYYDQVNTINIYLFSIKNIPALIKYGNGIELKSFYTVEYYKISRSVEIERLLVDLKGDKGELDDKKLEDKSMETKKDK